MGGFGRLRLMDLAKALSRHLVLRAGRGGRGLEVIYDSSSLLGSLKDV